MLKWENAQRAAIDIRNMLRKQYPDAESSVKVTYWRGVTKIKVKIKIFVNQ